MPTSSLGGYKWPRLDTASRGGKQTLATGSPRNSRTIVGGVACSLRRPGKKFASTSTVECAYLWSIRESPLSYKLPVVGHDRVRLIPLGLLREQNAPEQRNGDDRRTKNRSRHSFLHSNWNEPIVCQRKRVTVWSSSPRASRCTRISAFRALVNVRRIRHSPPR